MIIPLTLNMPSPSSSPAPSQPNNASISLNSQQAPPLPSPYSIICCSQLDEASATAAAAAATSSSSGVISGNDSDTSSNHSATKIKYKSLNSIKSSVSPSSSSSSISVSAALQATQQTLQQNCVQPTTSSGTCEPATLPNSPFDYNNYSGTTAHTFSNLQLTQQPHLPQFCRHNNGAVISVLNLPTKSPNSFAVDDCQQLQQQNQFYFNTIAHQKSADLINISPALTVANRCNNNSGYWTPSYHNNQFVYHQTSSTQVPVMPSTTSSSPSVSPRLPIDDRQQQIQERLRPSCSIGSSSSSPTPSTSSLNLNNIIVGNNTSNANSEVLLVASPYSSNSSVSDCSNNESSVNVNSAYEEKTHLRGPLKLLTHHQQQLIAQQLYQYPPSSTSSLSCSSGSTLTNTVRPRVVNKGEIGININNERNIQLPSLPQTAMTQSVNSSCISGVQPFLFPHPLPPHNLLYNNPQTHHMRALSSSSLHDFTIHTPPDRFLARAHLIEAKVAPATLLNNSKWDHLSRSIWQKFITSQQTEETFKQKMHLWRSLYLFIKNAYPRYGLYLVGSTISGFGSDSSDVDMCLVSRSVSSIDPRTEALFNLTVLRDSLSKSGEFENFNLIEAKVPILRFSDRMHQLEVDLNFNNCVGIKNTHLLYCYSQLDWRLRPLVLITKLWAQYHDINNAKNMTISSYSLVLMVIHFLQYAVSPPVLPCLHEILPDKFTLLRSNDFGYVDLNETIGPYDSKNCQTIGELFLLFLEYYSCFDYTQFAISVRTGGLLPISLCRTAKSIKNDIHQWKELCIEEPFDLTNTARSVYNYETFERIKAVFVVSWRILQETLDLNSVFSCSPDIRAIQNINSTISGTTFSEIETNVHVSDTKINFEQHEKEFRLSSSSSENKKLFIEYFDEEGDIINFADEDDDSSATVTKRKDLNRTLTPCQLNGFDEKEFPLSLSSASSLTCIKTNTKIINRTINNKTSTFIIT